MSQVEKTITIAEATQTEGVLRNYPAPWNGQLLLACRKCQKKLKHAGKKSKLSKLSKELKRRARKHEVPLTVTLLNVGCLDLCPKGGVTVCTQQQLAQNQCSILRNRDDVDALIEACRTDETALNTQSHLTPDPPATSPYSEPAYQAQSDTSS